MALIIMEYKNNNGFTLIELLIAMFIFSILVFAVSAVYLSFSKAQARTRASQQLLNDAQYALELMAREVRNDSMYDYTPTVADCNAILDSNYDTCLLLKRGNGELIAFAVYQPSQSLVYIIFDCNEDYSSCTWSDAFNRTNLLSYSLNEVRVTDLNFYIEPSSDPYESGINQQSKVTISMEVTYDSQRAPEQVSHRLQTTISARDYRR